MCAKYTNSESSTIRISKKTKEKLEKLDFVRKHSYEEIIEELIENYERKKK